MLILVTGSAGRLGSVIIPELIGNGHSIQGIDIANEKPENLLHTPAGKYIGVDCVLHLAAMTSVEDCEIDPLRAEEFNILATQKAVDIATENSCPILFFSSAAVYGDSGVPTSVYGKTKLAAEKLIQNSTLDYAILRLFNVITFDALGSSLIPSLQRALGAGELFYLYGDGSSTRDFISVHSLTEIVVDITENKKYENDIYDVGSGRSVSVASVITSISSLYAQAGDVILNIVKHPARKNEVINSVADIKKIRVLCPSVEIKDFYSTLNVLNRDTIYPTSRENND